MTYLEQIIHNINECTSIGDKVKSIHLSLNCSDALLGLSIIKGISVYYENSQPVESYTFYVDAHNFTYSRDFLFISPTAYSLFKAEYNVAINQKSSPCKHLKWSKSTSLMGITWENCTNCGIAKEEL